MSSERSFPFAAQKRKRSYVRSRRLNANEALLPEKILSIKGSTEPAFMAGMDVAVIDGDENNFKITTKQDLVRYIQIKSGNNESIRT